MKENIDETKVSPEAAKILNYNVAMLNDMAIHSFNVPKEESAAALFYYTVAHIIKYTDKSDGDEYLKPVKVDFDVFSEVYPVSKRALKNACDKALTVTLSFDTKVGTDVIESTYNIFSGFEWHPKGVATMMLNNELSDYLIALSSHFTEIKLKYLLRVSGKYQRRLLWYIYSQHNAVNKRNVTSEDMYDILALPKSQRQYKFIAREIKEFNDVGAGCTVVYDDAHGVLHWTMSN